MNNNKKITEIMEEARFHASQNNSIEEKRCLKKILALLPSEYSLYERFGDLEVSAGDFKQAKVYYTESIRLNFSLPQLYYKLGMVLTNLHELKPAIEAYKNAIKLKKDYFEAYYNMGVIFLDIDFYEDAIDKFKIFLNYFPGYADAYLNLGLAYHKLKTFDEAILNYQKALEIKPDYAEAFNNLGNAYCDLGQFQEAIDSFNRAIKNKINYSEALSNKGTALRSMERLDESLSNFNQAIKINPNYAEAISNRATLYEQKKMYINALKGYNKALDLQPLNRIYNLNKGMLYLKLGKFEKGWEFYESRLNIFAHKLHNSNIKELSRSDSINGKKIFVYSEQGLGDTIQFFRFIKILISSGAKVFFETQNEIRGLLKNSISDIEFVDSLNNENNYDYYCSLLSLPYLFNLKVEADFFSPPYIYPEINKVKLWANKLGLRSKYRIGLVWSGGFRKDQPELWAINRRRNIELKKFKVFSALDFIEFYSVQKGKEAVEQLDKAVKENWNGPKIIDYTDELNDFSDTAALIENLDLIISVDTSTAHLAAALGKPVWLLNRYDTCWRWLDDGRSDSIWYSNIRLFRQSKENDWDSVIAEVFSKLKKREFISSNLS